MEGRKLLGILLVVVLIGGVVYLRMKNRGAADEDVKTEAMAILAQVENYQANEAYYKSHADLAHQTAFDAAYQMGKRRQKASFDADVYIAEFFERMINKARDEGRQDIVGSLTKLRDDHGIPRPGGK